MILPSRQLWFISATVAVLIAVAATFVISRSGGCADDRPALDERVSQTAMQESRARFIRESEAQLVALAAEIERRATLPNTPMERIEQLRRDHVHLREQRQRVVESSDDAFEENLHQFDTHVNTVREQLARLDTGKLP